MFIVGDRDSTNVLYPAFYESDCNDAKYWCRGVELDLPAWNGSFIAGETIAVGIHFGSTTIDTHTYDDGGRMLTSAYNSGVSESRAYNNDNTLASISFTGAPIGNLSYNWDASKNKTREGITGTMSGYGFDAGTSGYDDEDRLVGWQRDDNNLDQAWNLSLVGDWNSFTENANVQSRTHGPAHELLSVASQAVAHDAKGNQTSIPAVLRPSSSDPLAMKWDFENKLISADIDNDTVADVTYQWDAVGRRVGRDDGTTATVFVQSGQQTIADYTSGTAAASPTYNYVYASYIDEPVMRTGSGGLRYYHRGQQYSVVAMTNGGGTITERYAYDAYGTPTITDASGTARTTSADNNRYMYTGREFDEELGLYHYRARIYDSVAGRFCSRDPIGFEGSKWNLFEYVSSSPTDHFDFSGLYEVECRAVHGWKGWLAKHCEIVPTCVPGPRKDPVYGEINYTCEPIVIDDSSSRKLDTGLPCSCATSDDIAACMKRHPSGRPKASVPGSNCQSDTIESLSSCCMQTNWLPSWYGFGGPKSGECWVKDPPPYLEQTPGLW